MCRRFAKRRAHDNAVQYWSDLVAVSLSKGEDNHRRNKQAYLKGKQSAPALGMHHFHRPTVTGRWSSNDIEQSHTEPSPHHSEILNKLISISNPRVTMGKNFLQHRLKLDLQGVYSVSV